MLLSDQGIKKFIEQGQIKLEPFDEYFIQPASIDIRLDKFFRIFNNHLYPAIDPKIEQADLTEEIEVPAGEVFILHPGEFVLGSTYEIVTLGKKVASRVEGKSSLGRLGILTHSTAGFIDPGFSGHITLELANVSNLPVKLYPGMKIGQLCFFEMDQEVATPYGSQKNQSRYQNQRGPTASKSFINFHQTEIF